MRFRQPPAGSGCSAASVRQGQEQSCSDRHHRSEDQIDGCARAAGAGQQGAGFVFDVDDILQLLRRVVCIFNMDCRIRRPVIAGKGLGLRIRIIVLTAAVLQLELDPIQAFGSVGGGFSSVMMFPSASFWNAMVAGKIL